MQHTHVLYSIVGFSIFLASAFFFIAWMLSREQQRKKRLFDQLGLLAEVTAQEKDKALITYQLHETFGATLSAIKLYMGSFQLTTHEVEHRQIANQHIDDLMTTVRRVALEYLPYSLVEKNLDMTIHRYVAYVNEQYGGLITLQLEEELPPIPTHQAVSIYRILQEVVENTIRHARATELQLIVKAETGKLWLVTKDNGIGFLYEKAVSDEKGAGLNNILNRVKLLKGCIRVDSILQQGTMYMIEMPL